MIRLRFNLFLLFLIFIPATCYLLPPSMGSAEAGEGPNQPLPFQQGIDLLNRGDLEGAIAVFQDAVVLNPDDPMPHYYTGLTYFRMRKYDLAIGALHRALEINPGLAQAHTGLGSIYERRGENDLARREYKTAIEGGDSEAAERLKKLDDKERRERIERLRRAEALFRDGRYEESLKALDVILDRNPDDMDALYIAGLIYAKKGGYKEAIERLKKALDVDPGNTGAHLQLGLVYAAGGAYAEAKGEFEAVISIAPEGVEAGRAREELLGLEKRIEVAEYFKQASEYREKKDLDAALSVAQKILSTEPENIFALRDMAVTYSLMGKKEEAIDVLKKAIKINPEYIEAHLELGIIYESLGRYEDAIAEYVAASGKETDDSKKASERLEGLRRFMEAKGRSERIKVLLEGGDLAGALQEAEAYVTEEKKNPKAHLILGRIYLRLGRMADAATRIKAAMKIDPRYWEAYITLGEVYEVMGKYPDARETYRAIISAAPDSPEGRDAGQRIDRVNIAMHFERAKTYVGEGDFEGALKETQGVLEIARDNPVALYNAGVIYDRLDRPEDAERFLKRAIQIDSTYVQAYLQLALVYEKMQRFADAEGEFRTVLSLTKEGREADIAKVRLGLLKEVEVLSGRMKKVYELMRKGDFFNAEKEVESAITIAPKNYIAYSTLGVILDKMERREEATRALRRSIEINEAYAPAHLFLGIVYEKENLFRDAREEYRKAITLGEGTREGEIATIRYKRLKNWKGSFSLGHTLDTNLSYGGAKWEVGVGSGYRLSLSYYLLRNKENLLSAGFSGSRSINYKGQLWGEGYDTNVRWDTTLIDRYRVVTGGNYTYSIFDRKPSYRSHGFFVESSLPTDIMPASLTLRYSFSDTDSFRSEASDAYQHSVSLSTSQRLSPKDTISGSYSLSSYVNKDPSGSNYANRSNNISINYSRFIKPGLSASAGFSIGLIEYMNPDSTTFYQEFRRNINQAISMDISYSLSERVSMSIGYDYVNATTNLPIPTAEKQQELEDILAAPIPTVGGGYVKHTLGMGFGIAF